MTAASGFKRLGISIAAVVAAAIALLASVPLLVPADVVRNAVKQEIQAVTGLDPVIEGGTTVSLFPWGKVTFTKVVLGDGTDRPPLVAEQLTARLRLWSLVSGRIEPADLALVRPRVQLVFAPDGRSNWDRLVDALAGKLKPGARNADHLPAFSEIRVTQGTIAVRDDSRGLDEMLHEVTLALAWPSLTKSFAATGRFVWRGEAINASITVADLFAALTGERAGLKVRLNGPPFKLAFDGHISHQPTLRMEGTLAADSESLRKTLVWAGQKPPPGGGFGRFALKAQTNLVGGTMALSAVNVELDGNSAEGVLSFASDGHLVQGTLAAEELDFTPYVSAIHLLRQSERDWSRVPIVLDSLLGIDLDLRLSAARITMASAKLGRTAVAVNLRSGRMTVAIGESQAFGGIIKGTLGIAKSDAGADVKSQLQFADVDLESCLGELLGVRRLEGKGTLAFTLDASGESVMALTRTLSGTATLSALRGALAGLNLEQLLRRLERRPLSGGGDFRTGRTPFDKLSVSLKLVQGTANVEDGRLEGTAVRLSLAGTASVPARDLDLKGTASLLQAAAPAADNAQGFELPFVVQGPWDDPIMRPDADSLIRRSGAGRELLNAVRDGKISPEAVRSAIEQLTGSSLPIPPAAAPAAPRPPGQ